MMEEARAADAAAREAARALQPRPTGFTGASAFEPLTARSPPSAPATPAPQDASALTSPRALAAEAQSGAPAQRELRAATQELERAQQGRQQADQELVRRLARVAAGLTPEQTHSFSQQNRQQHAAVYERETQAAERAATVLRERGAELRQGAETPEGARTVGRGLSALAQSPRAVEALQFAGQVVSGGGAAAQNLFATTNFGRDVLERGLPAAAGVLAGRGAEAAELAREVGRLAAPFAPAVAGGLQGHRVATEVQALLSGNMDAVRNLATRWNDSSSLMRAAGAAGLVISASGAGRSTAQGQPAAQQLEAWARAGQSGTELLSNVTRALGTGVRAAGTATALARLAPSLGLVANAASLAHNSSQFMQTRNPGFAIAATGDAIATLGSAIGSFPITAVPGAAVNALAQVVSAAGDLTANEIAHRRSVQEQVQQLEAGGMPRPTAEAMVRNPAAVHALASQGFTPEQIQRLASAQGEHFGRPADLQVFGAAASALGVDRNTATQALSALSRAELTRLAAGLAQSRSPAQQRAFLEDMVSISGFSPQGLAAVRSMLGR